MCRLKVLAPKFFQKMESVRARIFFSESLSDHATLATTQTKCMILVSRSEFPYISLLKEHIRKKFCISDEQRLELSIDGFVIPDWEKSEVIRENDIICVHALKASAHSHAFLEERSHKKKKYKRSREPDSLNCDNDSAMPKVTQVVHDVQDGLQVKKKKKLRDTSKKRNENETSTLNEVEDKFKTKHKKKDKKQAKEKMKRRKKHSDQNESLAEVRQMTTLEKDYNDENNQTKFSRQFTNDIVADGSELQQASLYTTKEVADCSHVHNKANGEDLSVNDTSTADKTMESNSGVGEASDKGSTQKKRRRRRRKRKSNVLSAGNNDLLNSTPNDKISRPNYSIPRNGMVESDRVKNSARIVNQVQSKSTMPKDETVALATSGGHIVFESESDGESDPLKLQPSEPLLETTQSKEVTTKDTPCTADSVVTMPAQQNQETEVESEMKVVRNEDKGATCFDCPTPPGAGDEVTEGNTVLESRDYDTYPPLNGPPRNGDIIAFKILELSAEYCPEVSEYKEGVVTEFNPSTQYVGIQLTKGPASKKELSGMSEGRFEMELDDEWTTDRNQEKRASLINVRLTSMIETKLLSV